MRYVKVPVVFDHFQQSVWAQLVCNCTGVEHSSVEGYGPTEDKAFADLLRELGCEEAISEV